MSRSFELDAPDHFTAGALGAPGQRVFYLQARESATLVTLKCEKEQIGALGDYLASLLAKLPAVGEPLAHEPRLLEPIDVAWIVASLGVGYDEGQDRIVIVVNELVEEDSEDKPASGRFRITRAQAAAFVERARALIKAGRPICPMCSQAKDPSGHICPRSNGYIVH